MTAPALVADEGNPLRILTSALACSPELGSEALVGYRLIEALRDRFDVETVTSAAMQAPAGVRMHSIRVPFDEPNDVEPSRLLAFEIRQRRVVSRLLRESQFDVLHRVTPSGYKHCLLPVPSAPLVLGPVLGSDPPPIPFDPIFRPRLAARFSVRSFQRRVANGVARRVFSRFSTLAQLLENAALIIAGTEVTRRNLPERLQPRCRVLTYSGVEHHRFTPPVSGRPPGVPELLFVGRLVPYKGVELLLRAAATARKKCEFQLKIVGRANPPYDHYCRELVAALKLADVVTFVGHVPRGNLVGIYQAADIFCMPSVETYGIAILEAMSSACAVLVADINGPGEIVRPGTGVKVPMESPKQFIEDYSDAVVRLISDAPLRRQLGERAREHVMQHHDWQRIAASLLEIYADAFPDGNSSGRRTPCQTLANSA